jgi:hypothetical protein
MTTTSKVVRSRQKAEVGEALGDAGADVDGAPAWESASGSAEPEQPAVIMAVTSIGAAIVAEIHLRGENMGGE